MNRGEAHNKQEVGHMARRSSVLLAVAFAVAGCVSVSPTMCVLESTKTGSPGPSFELSAQVETQNRQYLDVWVRNTGDQPIQLLLHEWTLAIPAGTSAAVPAGKLDGGVSGVEAQPILLAPGMSFEERFCARGQLGTDEYPNFFTGKMETMTVVNPILPYNAPCGATGNVTLAYAIQVGDQKVVRAAVVPFEVAARPNPAYRGPAGTR